MPSGYQPVYTVTNPITTATSGNYATGNLYAVSIYPSSYSRPGMIVCNATGYVTAYGSITYPV